jgi:hypothetical protein
MSKVVVTSVTQSVQVIQEGVPPFFLPYQTGPSIPDGGGSGNAAISVDANNALRLGSDSGLFVPEVISEDGGVDLVLIFNNKIV